MRQLILKYIRRIFVGINYYIPAGAAIWNSILRWQQKQLMNLIFKNSDTGWYFLYPNCKINLSKQAYLTQLILNDFEYEELFFLKLLLRKGDVVLDVGANVGMYSLLSAHYVGATGMVYAFEPVPNTIDLLRQNINANKYEQVLVIPYAVSNVTDANLKMYTDKHGFNVLDNLIAPLNKNSESIDVRTITLDEAVIQYGIQPANIRFIKIDVEGWEKYVLEGAIQLLKFNTPLAVMVEFSTGKEPLLEEKNKSVYVFMESLGYKWYRFCITQKRLSPIEQLNFTKECNLVAVNRIFKISFPMYF